MTGDGIVQWHTNRVTELRRHLSKNLSFSAERLCLWTLVALLVFSAQLKRLDSQCVVAKLRLSLASRN